MEALALLGLVVARLVSALLQFVRPVGEGARLRIVARPVQLPELADFCLEFHLEALLGDCFLLLQLGLLPDFSVFLRNRRLCG